MKKALFALSCCFLFNNFILNGMDKNEEYINIELAEQKITPKTTMKSSQIKSKKFNCNDYPPYCCDSFPSCNVGNACSCTGNCDPTCCGQLCCLCLEATPKCSAVECIVYTHACFGLCSLLLECFAICLNNR